MFKTNVQDLTGGLAKIMALAPKTYHFDVEGYPSMVFPAEIQNGLLAQEAMQVVPELVRDVDSPTPRDEEGAMWLRSPCSSRPSIQGLISYPGLCGPRANAAISVLQEQLTVLQAEVTGYLHPRGLHPKAKAVLRDTYAPVLWWKHSAACPQASYQQSLQRGHHSTTPWSVQGGMQLMASSADGKQLRTARSEHGGGAMPIRWSTTDP
ncbi:MAG: tail fiber domain-containing protein [Flavobacteriales bacterium]|nr:tail fiber domain-containing protein [Flavobacteriales bacterium]